MPITAANIKEIKQELAKLKPASITLEGNRVMTVKEAVFALAPTLERMKKRGFDTQELVERLHEKGIDVKPPTLAKYLNEFKRRKDTPKTKRQDTPPPLVTATTVMHTSNTNENGLPPVMTSDMPHEGL